MLRMADITAFERIADVAANQVTSNKKSQYIGKPQNTGSIISCPRSIPVKATATTIARFCETISDLS
jgi:hypothetical protein